MENTARPKPLCDFKQGTLPECGPLAAGFVPFQQENSPRYSANEGLPRGTLFPGLDLPLKNIANNATSAVDPMLGELMAMGFALGELGLYLDTHKNDTEAFELLKSCIDIYQVTRKKYVAEHGPLALTDLASEKSYTWLKDPWPWERSGN